LFMQSKSRLSVLLLVIGVNVVSPAVAADAVTDALALFRDYEARSARFDSALADLYSDDALIRTKRVDSRGVRELSFSGGKWKLMIRAAMPVAKMRGDTNRFSDLSARATGNAVVITAKRHSDLKGYTSPLTLIVRKDGSGAWKIVEEESETRP
jgi:ketosteroid isomerase-like protein